MPLDEMLVFARVVEHQSFAGAARQLGLTTSAVSRSVGRLEAHFGLRLLQRTTRSLSLTEAGAEIHQACLRLGADAQALPAPAGQLRQQPRRLPEVRAPALAGDIRRGLVAGPLKPIRYVRVATPGYLARHAQITEPGQLLAHPFISRGYGQFQNEVELRPLHPAAAPATRLLVNTPITIASSLGIIHALQQGTAPVPRPETES